MCVGGKVEHALVVEDLKMERKTGEYREYRGIPDGAFEAARFAGDIVAANMDSGDVRTITDLCSNMNDVLAAVDEMTRNLPVNDPENRRARMLASIEVVEELLRDSSYEEYRQ